MFVILHMPTYLVISIPCSEMEFMNHFVVSLPTDFLQKPVLRTVIFLECIFFLNLQRPAKNATRDGGKSLVNVGVIY